MPSKQVCPVDCDFVDRVHCRCAGLLRWLRAAELTCDRAALLVAQDRSVIISVLMKLAGGTPSFADELNIDAFLEQVWKTICHGFAEQ